MQRVPSSFPRSLLQRLDSHRLALHATQVAWWAAFLSVLAMYTLGMPTRIAQLVLITPYSRGMQLDATRAAYLTQTGVSLPVYFWYVFSLEIATALLYISVATLIYWRRPNEIGAILVSLLMLSYGCTETTYTLALKNAYPDIWLLPRRALQETGEWMSLTVFFIIPDGRFSPRWTRWLALGYGVFCLLCLIFPELPFNASSPTFNEWNPWSYLSNAGLHMVGFAALALRYRSLADGVQRQQIKWALSGLVIGASASIIRYALDPVVGALQLFNDVQSRVIFDSFERPVHWIFIWSFPVGLGFALLRRRLWDIDPIISRVVAYLLLTIALIMTTVLSSVGLERFFSTQLNSSGRIVVTVVATIGVLSFYGRLQGWLDRRFNRQRIDVREALRHLADEIAAMANPAQVQQILPEQVAQIARIEYSALLIETASGDYQLSSIFGNTDHTIALDTALIAQLGQGGVIRRPETPWPLLLPLRAPQADGILYLIGVLALGPHRSGRPYDRADEKVLQLLVDRAASTLALAVLIAHDQRVSGRVQISNPYRPNRPLAAESPLFVGRANDLAFLAEQLAAGVAIVLTGERRMGKTTLLQQLSARLGPGCLAVPLDGQRLAVGGDLTALCHEIASALYEVVGLPPPPFAAFRERPDAALLREAIPQAYVASGERRLVLLLDEFEELEQRVRDQQFDRATLGLLRYLMQHEDRITLLLVGSTPPEQLRPDLWPGLLNTALHQRIEPLAEEAARQLIVAPVAPQLCYEELALSQVLTLTGGHPYFIHVMCSTLILHANQHGRSRITDEDVAAAHRQALELAGPHLADLWHTSHAHERQLLQTLTEYEAGAVADLAAWAGLSVEHAGEAMRRLVRRGLLYADPDGCYRWRLQLFSAWVRQTAALAAD
jgi:hypothetical protein